MAVGKSEYAARVRKRNAGPAFGYAVLAWGDKWVPRCIFDSLVFLGAGIFLALMGSERRASREYLQILQGKDPSIWELWEHFYALTDSLIRRLRASRGWRPRLECEGDGEARMRAFAKEQGAVLFGTFHVGDSDLLGYFITDLRKTVRMVRLKVENSQDTESLQALSKGAVDFIWVNQPQELLFALKEALENHDAVALKADRIAHASRLAPFLFLGKRRMFPITIYHLSVMTRVPVIFAIGIKAGYDSMRVWASPVYRPDANASRKENLDTAMSHFQGVLSDLEKLLAEAPYAWFNFLPLNPEEGGSA